MNFVITLTGLLVVFGVVLVALNDMVRLIGPVASVVILLFLIAGFAAKLLYDAGLV